MERIDIQERAEEMFRVTYTPMDKESLVEYLTGMDSQWTYLNERQGRLQAQLEKLEKTKIVTGESLDSLIRGVALRTPSFGELNEIQKLARGNPDTLFQQVERVYTPYEMQRMILYSGMRKIIYDQWCIEKVKQCVDVLPHEERLIVWKVYIEHQSVKEFRISTGVRRSSYYEIKKKAFERLLPLCNSTLKEFYES